MATIDDVKKGTPALVLLSGEPGIGKSRLAREVADIAEQRDSGVCSGRFIEGSSIPYLPFANAIVPYLERNGILDDERLGSRSAVLRKVAFGTSPGTDVHPDSRGELVQALIEATVLLAARKPLVLVIDDLHWAEQEELEVVRDFLLGLLDRGGVEPVRVAMVLMHRPPGDSQALARCIARLRREPRCHPFALEGLSETELHELIRLATHRSCSASPLGALYAATQGNPLHAIEAVDALVRDGSLREERGMLVSAREFVTVPVPAELEATVKARVEELAAETRDVLAIASLLGDDVSVEELTLATGKPEPTILDILDSAEAHRVIVPVAADLVRFVHPRLRAALRDTLSERRRTRTHAEIAQRLSRNDDSDAAYVLRMAHHLVAAGNQADPAMRLRFTLRAARVAGERQAWRESARYGEAAIADAGEFAQLAPEDQAAHILATAVAHYHSSDPRRCMERYGEAAARFRELGDVEQWGEALEGWMSLVIVAEGRGALSRCRSARRAFLRDARGISVEARARVDYQYAGALYNASSPRSVVFADHAFKLAQESGDAELIAKTGFGVGTTSLGTLQPRRAAAALEESLLNASNLADPWESTKSLINLPTAYFLLGEFQRANDAFTTASETFASLGKWGQGSFVLGVPCGMALLRGDFDSVERHVQRSRMQMQRTDWRPTAPEIFLPLALSRAFVGRHEHALDAVGMLAEWAPEVAGALRPVIDAIHRGDHASVGQQPTREAPSRPLPKTMEALRSVALALEAWSFATDSPPPEGARQLLATAEERGVVFVPGVGTSVARLRAIDALASGERSAAAAHAERAAAIARSVSATLESGRCDLLRAQVLVQDDPAGARKLATEALATFEELGANVLAKLARRIVEAGADRPIVQPLYPGGLSSAEFDLLVEISRGANTPDIGDQLTLSPAAVERTRRGLALAGLDSPEAAHAYLAKHGLLPLEAGVAGLPSLAPGRFRVIMFTDGVASTSTNLALGDAAYARLIKTHHAIIAAEVARDGGSTLKTMGDGVMASFPTCAGALACAARIRTRFMELERNPNSESVPVRIGLHAGEPVDFGDDLIGLSVTIAARICARAGAGEVLVSDPVRMLASGLPFRFAFHGQFPLKGLDERVRLYRMSSAG